MSIIYGTNGIFEILDMDGNVKSSGPFESFVADFHITDVGEDARYFTGDTNKVTFDFTIDMSELAKRIHELYSVISWNGNFSPYKKDRHHRIMKKKIRKYARSIP